MKVRFIKQQSFQAAGPQGPMTRIFAIGDIVDLPEMHAQIAIAQGEATLDLDKPAKVVEADLSKTAKKSK